jgi:hypothetical protein
MRLRTYQACQRIFFSELDLSVRGRLGQLQLPPLLWAAFFQRAYLRLIPVSLGWRLVLRWSLWWLRRFELEPYELAQGSSEERRGLWAEGRVPAGLRWLLSCASHEVTQRSLQKPRSV